MKSSVETLDENKVKIYVEVDASEFDKDIDQAFRKIAKEVKLPGFRNGKAPRKLLEARIGTEAARGEAIRDSLPIYLAKAVAENNVDVISQPEIEVTGGQDNGDVEFEAEYEIRPTVTVPGYNGLRIEVSPIELTDEQITTARNAELKNYGTLVDAGRASEPGDFLVLDLAAVNEDGEEVMGLNTEDWSYELGQGWVTEDFDEHLTGVEVGDEITFTSRPKGTDYDAEFTVKVSKVQTLELPEIDDAWVADNTGEFDTVDEWTDSITAELRDANLNRARQEIGPKLSEALAALVEIDLPEPLVEAETNQQLQNMGRTLQQQGIGLQQWMEITGQSPEQMMEQMRPQAEQAVRVDLALRAVADAEQLDASDDDINAEFARMAMMFGRKAADIRKVYEDNFAMADIDAQIRKQKASDFLLESVEIVDTNGTVLDRDLLLGRNNDDEPANTEGTDQ